MKRASSSLASSGSPPGGSRFHDERVPVRKLLVRDPHRPPELLLRRRRERNVVSHRRAHLLAVPGHEQRSGQDDLRLEPVVLHDFAPGEQVVELIGAAELDVGLDRDGVVGLHQGIEQLGDRDRLLRGVALLEVVALEDSRNGHRPREAHHVRIRELRQPLAVVTHLGALGIEDLHRLLDVRVRVRIDLLVGEDRPLC